MTREEKRVRRLKIANAVRDGLTTKEICFAFDVTLHLVHSACKEHGVDRVSSKIARRKEIATFAAENSVKEACERFGVSTETVHKSCKAFGVSLKDQVTRTSFHVLAKLLNTSLPVPEIARAFRMSQQRVHQILSEARTAGIRVRTE